ncbi:BNR-4 repeat-containing protein [Flammeovirga sp. OC4]|uniref:BNR-4 repeat-containing protein n=1 Tax=Flammeovirga sp. OC4 TaxID=1382345 RepID=UPI0007C855C9|nr:BNR-4 repeat-containing protein [Flammeovirga sp. OC4]
MRTRLNKQEKVTLPKRFTLFLFLFILSISNLQNAFAQVQLLKELQITNKALYFDGVKDQSSTNKSTDTPYDYAYGRTINPHGDCIKTYKHYVFMTWYRGGKEDRHVMLTRYNTQTGAMKTIEFPHQHTGLTGKWWIGETHNTIAIGICPRNGTIHLAYDMHAYRNVGNFTNDYFRYSYSQSNTVEVADSEFTLDKFVKDPIDGDYRHCTMNGVRDADNFSRMTYPEFFLNDDDELFLKMRQGSSYDGAMAYIKYDDSASKWGKFEKITALGAQSKGETHNWSIYGNVKFAGGKMRLGFQRRLHDGTDKFQYQNGVYYAYSDDPTGATQWKNHKGQAMTFPLVKASEVLVFEPGDWVETTQKNMVHIVGGFDFEVTDRGDEHIVSQVKDKQYNITKKLHTYRKAGDSDFTTVEYNAGSELYASGDNIYVIGLNGGRVNIVKTEGGTSNFEQVYQHTSGPTFDKGIVHINDGKLYYYLKTTGNSGDECTTYLQVFDLGITPSDVTSTEEIIKGSEELLIYPNPATKSFRIDMNGKSAKDVSIYTLNGTLIYQKNDVVDQSEINIDGQSAGLYVLKVTLDNGQKYSQKLMIE